eukprot:TRINITY_DN1254_c0_g1_i3.p1 TRINITY_DN1254_c0_g1~~TRINITY_DN1254_c0_g1_i3.p1  ORF type:complete len:1131 (+),score=337.19 TRINITY_DN1254_c0_g1_i3:132-3524(+)
MDSPSTPHSSSFPSSEGAFSDFLRASDNPSHRKIFQKYGDSVVLYSQNVSKISKKKKTKPKIYELIVTDQHCYLIRSSDGLLRSRMKIGSIVSVDYSETVREGLIINTSSHSAGIQSRFRGDIVAALRSQQRRIAGRKVREMKVLLEGKAADERDIRLLRQPSSLRGTMGPHGKGGEKDLGRTREEEETILQEKLKEKEKTLQDLFSGDSGFLLTNIAESGFVERTVATVLEKGLLDRFRWTISQFMDSQKDVIECLCFLHYEEFLRAVDGLKSVRQDATELREFVRMLGGNVQDSGIQRLEVGEDLQRHRFSKQNVELAIDCIDRCATLAELSAQCDRQIHEQKFDPALRTLNLLETQLHPLMHYEYAQFLAKRVPFKRREIKDHVMKEFNRWLVQVRQEAFRIGKDLMHDLLRRVPFPLDSSTSASSSSTSSSSSASSSANLAGSKPSSSATATTGLPSSSTPQSSGASSLLHPLEGLSHSQNPTRVSATDVGGPSEFDGLSSDTSVDFAPLYTCMSIYSMLGEESVFKEYYSVNRKKQIELDLVLPKTTDFPQTSLEYFARIAGFFIIEECVSKAAHFLVSKPELEILWDVAVSRIGSNFTEMISFLHAIPDLLRVRHDAMLFSTLMELYGFHVSPFHERLGGLKKGLDSKLRSYVGITAERLLSEERFEPHQVMNANQWERDVEQFGLLSPHEEDVILRSIGKSRPLQHLAMSQTASTVSTGTTTTTTTTTTPSSSAPFGGRGLVSVLTFPVSVPFSKSVPAFCRLVVEVVDWMLEFSRGLSTMDTSVIELAAHSLSLISTNIKDLLDKTPFSRISLCAQIATNARAMSYGCRALEGIIQDRLRRKTESFLSMVAPKSILSSRVGGVGGPSSGIESFSLSSDDLGIRKMGTSSSSMVGIGIGGRTAPSIYSSSSSGRPLQPTISSSLSPSSTMASSSSRSHGVPMKEILAYETGFVVLASHAEEGMFQSMMEKIDTFMTMYSSEKWNISTIPKSIDPSSCIVDMLMFLETSIGALGIEVQDRIRMECCDHIAHEMLRTLASPAVPKLSQGGILRLQKDIESICKSLSKRPDDSMCQKSFEHLARLIEFAKNGTVLESSTDPSVLTAVNAIRDKIRKASGKFKKKGW